MQTLPRPVGGAPTMMYPTLQPPRAPGMYPQPRPIVMVPYQQPVNGQYQPVYIQQPQPVRLMTNGQVVNGKNQQPVHILTSQQQQVASGQQPLQVVTNGQSQQAVSSNTPTSSSKVTTVQSPTATKPKQHIPLAKCRVLYLGSSVPLETTQGLDAVQLPLKERYPFDNQGDVPGIDAWLTVFSSGLMMQYVNDKSAKTWFPIQTLHVCAAVKCIVQLNGATGEKTPKFVALDSETAENSRHPPMFACIMRRTKGVKVLECHVFITKSNQAAMALVQSSTHAFEHKEGWTDDRPELETLNAPQQTRLIPADPPPKQDAPPEFFKAPPERGYYYASNKELVKNYSVMGEQKASVSAADIDRQSESAASHHSLAPSLSQQMGPRSPQQMTPGHHMGGMYGPRHPHMGPPYGAPMMPQMMPGYGYMPMPPPGYFSDWGQYGGRPVAVMGEQRYNSMQRQPPHRSHRENRADSPKRTNKKKSKSPPRHKKQQHRHRSPPREYSAPRGMETLHREYRPQTPPADYDRGAGANDYSPPPSDLIMYADDYRRDERNGKVYSHFSPEIFMRGDSKEEEIDAAEENFPYRGFYERELPEQDDRRFPRQEREFGASMKEERNLVGDYAGYPDAYKLNIEGSERDNDSNINYDYFHRAPNGYDGARENGRGYKVENGDYDDREKGRGGYDMDREKGRGYDSRGYTAGNGYDENGHRFDNLESTLGYFP